jgi:hypothetical protein
LLIISYWAQQAVEYPGDLSKKHRDRGRWLSLYSVSGRR